MEALALFFQHVEIRDTILDTVPLSCVRTCMSLYVVLALDVEILVVFTTVVRKS
jgi:hypothetical protein